MLAQVRPRVTVELSADRVPEAYVTVRDLLADDRFLGAMESGFPLYVEYRVELKEARPLWDRLVAREEWEFVVLYDPVRDRFVVEEAEGTEELPTRNALRRRLGATYLLGWEPDGSGEFYYQATVSARTLSDEDVDEVFAWLKGGDADSLLRDRPGLLTRTARRLLVRIAPLPRLRLEARSRGFPRPP